MNYIMQNRNARDLNAFYQTFIYKPHIDIEAFMESW